MSLAEATTMRFEAFATALLAAAVLSAQDSYFPKAALDNNDRLDATRAHWYSCQLKALDEPSLLDAAKDPSLQAYRFIWLRTFHHPVAVRIEVMADGTAKLTAKVASGAGGYDPGKLVENSSRLLTQAQTDKFLRKVDRTEFWKLPGYDHVVGVTARSGLSRE
jgi:hypothetical protein